MGVGMRGQPTGLAVSLAAALAFTGALAGCTGPETPGPTPFESSPSEPSVHFTASGDFTSSPAAAAVLTDVAQSGADLHLALGDFSYGRRGEEGDWCDFVTGHLGEKFPFQLLTGNHESDGRNGHIDQFAQCLPNRLPGLRGQYARQYFVDLPTDQPLVRFVLISPGVPFDDGAWSYDQGSPRYDWTEAAIDGARASGIRWVVVGMHMPCLSVGRYGCGAGADLTNLLVEERVDLVLSGHEHIYQRTHQLRTGSGCEKLVPGRFDPACVADSDSRFEQGAGTVFATVGTAGVQLREINRWDSEYGYVAVAAGFNEVPAWGSLEVRLSGERLSASFLRAQGDSLRDAFTIATPGPPAG
jgi:3',5'-cyclic AMP phosphodiesterase CpdA